MAMLEDMEKRPADRTQCYGLNGFFRLDNLTAPVITATGTSVMQELRRAAVGAFRYLRFLQATV